jgi:hypothetical protein
VAPATPDFPFYFSFLKKKKIPSFKKKKKTKMAKTTPFWAKWRCFG